MRDIGNRSVAGGHASGRIVTKRAGPAHLTLLEKMNDTAGKEYDLSLVRSRSRGRGAVLRQDVPRFDGGRGAPRTRRFPVGEEGGRFDRRVYGDWNSLPRTKRRARVQAQRSVLVPDRDR